MDKPIQTAIDALREVLNIHENHLYPDDRRIMVSAISRLLILERIGFKTMKITDVQGNVIGSIQLNNFVMQQLQEEHPEIFLSYEYNKDTNEIIGFTFGINPSVPKNSESFSDRGITEKLHNTSSAIMWVTEFMWVFDKHFRLDGPDFMVERDRLRSLLLTWFANAIEVGRNVGKNESTEKVNYIKECIQCGTKEGNSWWKCCTMHTAHQGNVVCDSCMIKCRIPRKVE